MSAQKSLLNCDFSVFRKSLKVMFARIFSPDPDYPSILIYDAFLHTHIFDLPEADMSRFNILKAQKEL